MSIRQEKEDFGKRTHHPITIACTRVTASKTETDIEELLAKHGAIALDCSIEGDRLMVAFNISSRRVQIIL